MNRPTAALGFIRRRSRRPARTSSLPAMNSRSSALSSTAASMDSSARDVNHGLATLRTTRCSGGSMLITTRIVLKPGTSVATCSRGASVIPGPLRNLSGCFEIEVMSACFTIDQKGSRPGISQRATGALLRSSVKSSWGGPASA